MKNLSSLLSTALTSGSQAAYSQEATNSKEIKDLYMNEQGFFTHCVPKKFAHVTLAHCDQQPASFIEYAKSWAKNPESVILKGPVGRGKTQFAFAMLRQMFRSCPRVIWPRYYTSPDLDSILLEASRGEGEKYRVENIGTQDLLFIDDFGRETDSARMRRQYFEILNMRYAKMLPLIISTNMGFPEIAEKFTDAIASRFQEYQIIEFNGLDLRIMKKL